MHRKLKALVLAFSLSAAASGAVAQDFVFSWSPRTGDVWVDQRLGDMNDYGYRYREPFIDEMTRYYGAPRELVSDLIINRRWAPGDVYYACSIAQIVGRPCRYVVDEWGRDHGQGWGVVAQRLGIKPGSEQFHRLKRGFVPTYDRWQRPIVLDRDLAAHFPNRGKTGGPAVGTKGNSKANASTRANTGGKAKADGGKGQGSGKTNAGGPKGQGSGKAKSGGGKGNGKG